MRTRRVPISPDQINQLRGAVAAAIPPQYREPAAALGRVLLGMLENPPTSPPPAGMAASTAAGQGAPTEAAAPPPAPSPPPTSPALERLIGALRAELDRQGVTMPERRSRRIPCVFVDDDTQKAC